MEKTIHWENEIPLMTPSASSALHRMYGEFSHVKKVIKKSGRPVLSGIRGAAMRRSGTNEIRFLFDRMPPLLDNCFLLFGYSPFLDRNEGTADSYVMAQPQPAKPDFSIGAFSEGVATKMGVAWRDNGGFAGRMHWPFGFEDHEGMIVVLLVQPY